MSFVPPSFPEDPVQWNLGSKLLLLIGFSYRLYIRVENSFQYLLYCDSLDFLFLFFDNHSIVTHSFFSYFRSYFPYIYIIFTWRCLHGSPWSSLTTCHYRPSLPEDFQTLSCIDTELLYKDSSWSSYRCSPMWRGPLEYITFEFVLTFPAVSRMSGSSNLDSFLWWVVGGRALIILWGVASRICSILHVAFLCNCRQAGKGMKLKIPHTN